LGRICVENDLQHAKKTILCEQQNIDGVTIGLNGNVLRIFRGRSPRRYGKIYCSTAALAFTYDFHIFCLFL